MSRDVYESELTASREEIATVLHDVADGVLAGGIRLGDGDDAITVDTPNELSLEVELETEDDESSLELELEWDTDDVDGVSEATEVSSEAAEDEETTPTDASSEAAQADEGPVLAGPADDSQSLARFEVFRDRGDEWRWRLRHRNGNIIATSGEGYTRKHNAWKGLRSVVANSPDAEVVEESTE